MEIFSEDLMLEKLKKEDSASFELLYNFYYPSISAYVKQNSGNKEDAEDVFQEAIMVLLQKVREPQFILVSSLKTYLFAIAKNIWLKRLRSKNLFPLSDFESFEIQTETNPFELKPEKTREEKLLGWLSKITLRCQMILKSIFFQNINIEKIMERMGWKNKHTASNQQYKCIQQLKKQRDLSEDENS